MQSPATTDSPPTGATRLPDLCAGILDEILLRLESEGLEGNDDLVHQVRVMTKRLRAAWKLIKGVVPDETVKERRTALREISAEFSGSRDQAVLKELCASLAEGKADEEGRALRSLCESNLLIESPPSGSPEALARQLEEEKAGWSALDWSTASAGFEIIRQNLEESIEKARGATESARKTSCSETWHDWRKVVKQLRYQSEFLAEMEGRPLTEFDLKVAELGSLLGRRNDLANLEALAGSGAALSQEDRAALVSVLESSTAGLLEECLRLGKKLFPGAASTG